MIVGLIGLGRVSGAEWFLAGACLSILLMLGLCMLFPWNRTSSCAKRLLVGVLGSAAACDLLLLLILFPQGEYRNYGIGAAYAALLYPVVPLVACVIITMWNREE